jgi:hypothetical protein
MNVLGDTLSTDEHLRASKLSSNRQGPAGIRHSRCVELHQYPQGAGTGVCSDGRSRMPQVNAPALPNGRSEQPTESMVLARPRAGSETRAALWQLPLRSLRTAGLFLSPKGSGRCRHITPRAIESKAGGRDPAVSSDRRRTESRCYSLPESGRCLEGSCPPHLHKKWGALCRTTLRP